MDLATARRVVRKRQRATATSDRDAFELRGGLNLVDPPLTIKPGFCLADENYEIGVQGGYERLGGFERFDGRASPSAETYYVLPFRHSAVFPPTMQPGAIFKNNAGTNAGTILEVVYATPPGRNLVLGAEDLNSATGLDASVASTPPPMPLFFPVQPTGKGILPEPSSGATAPRISVEYTENTTNTQHRFNKLLAVTDDMEDWITGERIIFSVFIRQRAPDDRRYIHMRIIKTGLIDIGFAGGPATCIIDLVTQTAISNLGGFSNIYVEDHDYGNGWQRWVFETTALTETIDPNTVQPFWRLEITDDDPFSGSHVGDPTKGMQITGFQYDKGTMLPPLTPYRSIPNNTLADREAGVGYLVYRGRTVVGFCGAGLTQNYLKDSTGAIVAMASGNETEAHAPTIEEHLDYLKSAADAQRALVTPLPGGGAVRGVMFYNGKVFGFRDDSAVCKMYKSGAGGWTQVTFAAHLNFDAGLAAGAAAVIEGATITGGTSGATAVIRRVNLTNSNWAGNGAIGTLVIDTIVGGPFQNNESLTISAVPVATADGANYTPTWTAGGRYRFRTHNFFGAANKRRMYGVNGLNRYFEYDDNDGILASYRTGMTNDAPTHIGVDQLQIVLSFLGGSVQRSSIGLPAVWAAVSGALEIGVGDQVTGFLEEVGKSLFIFTRGQTYQLSGSVAAGFALDRFDPENGAIENSIQRIGLGIHLDDRGFGSLISSDKHGNYEANTFSRLIQPLVDRKLKETAVTESVIYRRRNRYRCFFADRSFISIGVDGSKVTGHMACDYGKVVRCACSEEDVSGAERIFFGSDDGYVYEAEKGTSFDGEPIRSALRLPFHHSGRPNRVKTYRSGRIEAVLDGQATLFVTPDLSFGDVGMTEREITATVGGAIWDHTMEWEGFNWDQRIEPLKEFRIGSDGTNISLHIRHESAVERPHTLRAVVYQTSLRGLNRSTRVG
jgi:hypothetical protein